VTDPAQKEAVRAAISQTLHELGPAFGLKGPLLPSSQNRSRNAEDLQSIKLSNELKTEVMHNAARILRQRMQGSELRTSASLERVVNLKDGILHKMLGLGRTGRRPRSPQKESDPSNQLLEHS